jgi:hypothetical protein
MAPPASAPVRWAYDPAALRTTPPVALQQIGWAQGERPAAAHINDLLYHFGEWTTYLYTGQLTLSRIDGSGGSFGIYSDTIAFRSSSGTLRLTVSSSGVIAYDTIDAQDGILARAEASSGVRLSYRVASTGLDVYADLSGDLGSWAVCQPNTSAEILYRVTGTGEGYLYHITGGATPRNAEARQSLAPWLLENPTADVLTTVRYSLVELTGTITGSATTKVQIVSVTKSTGAESILFEIDSGNATDNNGGIPIDVDTSTKRYFVRIYHALLAVSSSTADVGSVRLKIRKFAVE